MTSTNFPNNIYGKGIERVEPRAYFARDVVNKKDLEKRYISGTVNPYMPNPSGFAYRNFVNGYGYGNVVGNHNRTLEDIMYKQKKLEAYSPYSSDKYNQYM